MSTFGATNGSIMSSARVYFAMARDGVFWKPIARVHHRFHTPSNSLLLQFVWASILVLSGTFDMLTDMLIFVSWIFYGLGAFGVFILRVREPSLPRPYKVWGYPVVPALFVSFSFLFVVMTLVSDFSNYNSGRAQVVNSLFGLFLISSGIPLYFIFKKKTSDQS